MESTSTEEYLFALKQGRKEVAELSAQGKPTEPAVLDELLPGEGLSALDLGTLEIPIVRIVGTKSAGRISALSPAFRPLLDAGSEFAAKWIRLCDAHMSDAGITDPIECFEYLGLFYVQEGNKRVSVLRHFGACDISAHVKRILPPAGDTPEGNLYREFLDFYKITGLYTIRYRTPGHYGKLLSGLGMGDAPWSQEERRTFRAYYQYFLDAFQTIDTAGYDILPEEALLLWLKVYSFSALGSMSAGELKKHMQSLRADLLASRDGVHLQTHVDAEAKGSLLDRLFSSADEGLKVAFVHQNSPLSSAWTLAHDQGRIHIQQVFGDKIQVRYYIDADTAEKAEAAMDAAAADGAQVVFTTAPTLSTATLKAAVKYPKVMFFNCCAAQPYSSVRSYYARTYESKFITGAIAGALAQNDRIGYVGAYPILGESAAVNAFALGAQLTNPRAQIELRWSAMGGSPQAELFAKGIRVISNRDNPVRSETFLDFCAYGTYLMDDSGSPVSLASPVWLWGKFYEYVIRSLFNGTYRNDKSGHEALNYWLGLDSSMIGVDFSRNLPEGVRTLAQMLRRGIEDGSIDPFKRRIVAQDGSVKNDGSLTFTPEEILHMDWLCENVVGEIPSARDIAPMAKPLVRQMGIFPEEAQGGGTICAF